MFQYICQPKFQSKQAQQNEVIKLQFEGLSYNLRYTNHYYMRQNQVEHGKKNQIKISNVLCQQEGDTFKKTTEIHVGKRVIVLEDHYIFLNVSPSVSQIKRISTENDTSQLQSSFQEHFDKNLEIKTIEPTVRRTKDKKNVVKNIAKGYQAWIQKDSQLSEPELVQKQIARLYQSSRFNAKFILKLIDEPVIRPSFEYFVKIQSRKWLRDSKIKAKQLHHQTLETYRKWIEDETSRPTRL